MISERHNPALHLTLSVGSFCYARSSGRRFPASGSAHAGKARAGELTVMPTLYLNLVGGLGDE